MCFDTIADLELRIERVPISVNHMYGSRGPIRFLKKEGKEYKEELRTIAASANVTTKGNARQPHRKNISMEVTYYFKDRRRRDVTNYDKPILDALTGIVYVDDSQVTDIVLRKRIDKGYPRTEIRIWRRNGDQIT